MKKINTKTAATFGMVIATAITSASTMAADETNDTGWYVGGNVGQSRAEIDNEKIVESLFVGGLGTTSLSTDESDAGFKVFGGYQFNSYFAVEAGYFDLGDFGFKATTLPPGSLSGNIKLQGLNLDLVGLLPITQDLSAFARVGVNYAEADDSFHSSGAVTTYNYNPNKRDTNYKYGFGLQYAITDSVDMRLEAERYHIDDAVGNRGDIDLLSLGVVYRFGEKSRQYDSDETPPVAAAAEPTPPHKVIFSADSMFDFDNSTIKPEGKPALDKLASELDNVKYNLVAVTGHTDRIGSHEYNLKLSQRRAESVKDYLVERGGIPADKIEARGTNGSDPVTRPGDCVGETATAQLIACLQPDRRVEVEVTGMEQTTTRTNVHDVWIVNNDR